jgi:threonine dehydrogenase-like Zn-dependent dehydrogenase
MSRREVKLLSAMGRTGETWRRMTQLIESDKLRLRPLIDAILPLDQFAEGFEAVKGHQVQKVLLRP